MTEFTYPRSPDWEAPGERNRRTFLRLAYQCGFHDGFHLGDPIPGRYRDDEEAQMRYRIGAKQGKLKRGRFPA